MTLTRPKRKIGLTAVPYGKQALKHKGHTPVGNGPYLCISPLGWL